MHLYVKWVEDCPEREFWTIFDEHAVILKDDLSKHFRSPADVSAINEVSVYYALLYANEQPAAGCIFIYFPKSNSLLLRHLFFKNEFRKEFDLDAINPTYEKLNYLFDERLSNTEEKKGISYLLAQIKKRTDEDQESIFVFGETINVLKAKDLSLDEHQKINKQHRFYASIGAKTFETDKYIRPILESEFNNQPLALLNFPKFHKQPFSVPIRKVMLFASDYFYFLSKNDQLLKDFELFKDKSVEADIQRISHQPTEEDLFKYNFSIQNHELKVFFIGLLAEKYEKNKTYVYLCELPRLEEPKIVVKRASICFELMVDEDYYEPIGIEDKQEFGKINEDDPDDRPWYTFSNNSKSNPDSKSTRNAKINTILSDGYCIIHHSFEIDLLAYKYQTQPPFFTKNYRPNTEIKIKFPEYFNFISEGRKEKFYELNIDTKADIIVNCILNYSYFLNSRIRIWHVVVTSNDEKGISEFDIIKLMKFFSGSQESISEIEKKTKLEEVKFGFNIESAEMDNFLNFFKNISGITYQKREQFRDNNHIDTSLSLLKNIKTGIVQVDSKYTSFSKLVEKLKEGNLEKKGEETVEDALKGEELTEKTLSASLEVYHNELYEKISKAKKSNTDTFENIEYLLNTFCGIALGIFDFERMGGQEVGDTLNPRPDSLDENYFLTINRGVITSFSIGDDVLDSTWRTLGINPYLVIPSAVLVHNEYVSTDADNRLTVVLERCRVGSPNSIKVNELIEERNYIDDLVNDDILSNVFQYKSEKDLYEYGMQHRGINERIMDARAKLNQLDKIIEQTQTQKSIENERLIQSVLTLLSLLQIASFFADFGTIENDGFSITQIATIGIVCVLSIVLGYLILVRNAPIRMKRKRKK